MKWKAILTKMTTKNVSKLKKLASTKMIKMWRASSTTTMIEMGPRKKKEIADEREMRLIAS